VLALRDPARKLTARVVWQIWRGDAAQVESETARLGLEQV
jgi:hypothetical protein